MWRAAVKLCLFDPADYLLSFRVGNLSLLRIQVSQKFKIVFRLNQNQKKLFSRLLCRRKNFSGFLKKKGEVKFAFLRYRTTWNRTLHSTQTILCKKEHICFFVLISIFSCLSLILKTVSSKMSVGARHFFNNQPHRFVQLTQLAFYRRRALTSWN